MSEQQQGAPTIPCGRQWDHEPHPWFTDEHKQCPGKIRMKVEDHMVEDRPAPDFVRCGSTFHASRCVQAHGHTEPMHRNDSGDEWGVHAPWPPQDDLQHHPMYQTLGDIATALREMKTDGMTLDSILYVAREQVFFEEWDEAQPVVPRAEPEQATAQCYRTDAHGGHVWATEFSRVWCDGIKVHPNCMIAGAEG